MKLAFNCDYLEGAHEKILKRLIDTNREKTVGHPILFAQRGCCIVHLYKIEWNFLLTYPVRMVK